MTTRGKAQKETIYAYAAGIIDGEGSISITKTIIKGYRSPRFVMEITATNTDMDMIDFMFNNFGGSYKKRQVRDRRFERRGIIPVRRITYHWKITAKKALKFLELIYPYLITKQKQAKLAIEFQKNKMKGRRMVSEPPKTHVLSEDEIQKREWYHQSVMRLNKGLLPAETKRENA